jgi:methionyl-tRNA formyltransferase
MNYKNLRIVFMGTPEFAALVLKALVEDGCNIVGVVTVPDKPAGRGQKLQESEVKKYALSKNINILQPEKLKNPDFINSLEALKPDVQVVVAFRMLPEVIWQIPQLGTFNLHASLLPQYRGAAPINWAIINGETKTGLTTFLIDKEIDTGKIIHKNEIGIKATDSAGDLHDKMIPEGARLAIKTLKSLANGNIEVVAQNSLIKENKELKPAPKIFKTDCRINWQLNGNKIYNLIRGLSPYPCAWTEIGKTGEDKFLMLKIFESELIKSTHNLTIGSVIMNDKKLLVAINDGYIQIKNLQLEGKKRLNAEEFLRGFKIDGYFVR